MSAVAGSRSLGRSSNTERNGGWTTWTRGCGSASVRARIWTRRSEKRRSNRVEQWQGSRRREMDSLVTFHEGTGSQAKPFSSRSAIKPGNKLANFQLEPNAKKKIHLFDFESTTHHIDNNGAYEGKEGQVAEEGEGREEGTQV
jgi:hypothetical protein